MSQPQLTREQTEAWKKPYSETDELVETARELSNSVTDPKLKNSQVCLAIPHITALLHCLYGSTIRSLFDIAGMVERGTLVSRI